LSLCGATGHRRWRGGVGAGCDHGLPINQRVQASHHRHPSDLRLPQSHRDADGGQGDTRNYAPVMCDRRAGSRPPIRGGAPAGPAGSTRPDLAPSPPPLLPQPCRAGCVSYLLAEAASDPVRLPAIMHLPAVHFQVGGALPGPDRFRRNSRTRPGGRRHRRRGERSDRDPGQGLNHRAG
jgi:hypothetical protein